MPTHQIKQRKQENPHDIDKMPIEPYQLDRRVVDRGKASAPALTIKAVSRANPIIICNACIPVMAK